MRPQTRFVAVLGLALYLAASCYGATVSGTVKGPDGAPIEGAFVQAQNTKTKISMFVLSDRQGHYRADKLPAGEYRRAGQGDRLPRGTQERRRAYGGAKCRRSIFRFSRDIVRWNELSIYQAKKLWPEEKAKQTIFTNVLSATDFKRAWRL